MATYVETIGTCPMTREDFRGTTSRICTKCGENSEDHKILNISDMRDMLYEQIKEIREESFTEIKKNIFITTIIFMISISIVIISVKIERPFINESDVRNAIFATVMLIVFQTMKNRLFRFSFIKWMLKFPLILSLCFILMILFIFLWSLLATGKKNTSIILDDISTKEIAKEIVKLLNITSK